MKRAVVIGLGDISEIHLNAIQADPEIRLCAVCDIDPSRRTVAEHWNVPFYEDFRQMVAVEKPDCAHICLPHWLHYPVAAALAEEGVNFICEKPEALSPKQAEQFCRLEREHPELHMSICLQNRRNKTVELLLDFLRGGECGKVTGVRGSVFWSRPPEYYAAKPWRGRWETAGSGNMMNQSIHTLDLMYCFAGPVAKVKALVGQTLEYGIEVEDTVAAHLNFANGASGYFTATNANYKNEAVQVRVQTENTEFELRENRLYRIGADGTETLLAEDETLPGTKFYYGASHRKLIADFYHDLETGEHNYITVRDGAYAVCLIDSILCSGRTGQPQAVTPPCGVR